MIIVKFAEVTSLRFYEPQQYRRNIINDLKSSNISYLLLRNILFHIGTY